MRIDLTFLFLLTFIFSMAPLAQAEARTKKPYYPIIKFYDYNHPRTRNQVLNAYPWRVNTQDGVDYIEARIIAQHEIIVRELDGDYDISKAKIIQETDQHFVIQIPAKFSLMNRRGALRYLVSIDKKNGTVKSVQEDSQSPL